MTKQEAFELLSGIRAAIIYGFVLQTASNDGELAERIRGQKFGFEADDGTIHPIGLTALAALLADRDQRRTIHGNYKVLMKHTLVRTTHEVVLMYCRQTNQFPLYKAEPWFQFARLVRNLLSHEDGAILNEWPKDLTKAGVTYVEWRGRKISATEVGQHVRLDPAEMVRLHEDMAEFLRTKLV